MEDNLIISKGTLKKNQMVGKVVLITGAGGGIGFETARSLLWLGAKVIIAELNKKKGKAAENRLNKEFDCSNAWFIHTDIRSERSIKSLYKKVICKYGRVDVILNNATIATTGAVHEVGIQRWDMSYKVNLRGPVLLLNYFLPDMIKRNSGVLAFVPSSGAAPYLGAYEVFKTSQVELCNTLAAELEGTGVITYSVGPGMVKTETADNAVKKIAPLYGKSVEEFYEMNKAMILAPSEAGAGFAASIALAEQYNGMEVSSIQALIDCGISTEISNEAESLTFTTEQMQKLNEAFELILTTYEEQVDGWSNRPIFEKQWVLRDFKKTTGTAPEHFIEVFNYFDASLKDNQLRKESFKKLELEKLELYYKHQLELLKGYERNPEKLKLHTDIINNWINDINKFMNLCSSLDVI